MANFGFSGRLVFHNAASLSTRTNSSSSSCSTSMGGCDMAFLGGTGGGLGLEMDNLNGKKFENSVNRNKLCSLSGRRSPCFRLGGNLRRHFRYHFDGLHICPQFLLLRQFLFV